MKFSKYLKVTCFSLVIFLYVSNFAYAQRDLRGWHTQGQTFLAYEIYTSSQPITSFNNATWIGRVYMQKTDQITVSMAMCLMHAGNCQIPQEG